MKNWLAKQLNGWGELVVVIMIVVFIGMVLGAVAMSLF